MVSDSSQEGTDQEDRADTEILTTYAIKGINLSKCLQAGQIAMLNINYNQLFCVKYVAKCSVFWEKVYHFVLFWRLFGGLLKELTPLPHSTPLYSLAVTVIPGPTRVCMPFWVTLQKFISISIEHHADVGAHSPSTRRRSTRWRR